MAKFNPNNVNNSILKLVELLDENDAKFNSKASFDELVSLVQDSKEIRKMLSKLGRLYDQKILSMYEDELKLKMADELIGDNTHGQADPDRIMYMQQQIQELFGH